MKQFSRTTKTFTTVVAGATVLAVFGTGTAVAGGLITSKKIQNNTIKSIDVKDNNLKGKDVRDGTLTGADVADSSLTGADIADGSLSNRDVNVYFARVAADGTLADSSGGVTSSKPQTGEYVVDFGRRVDKCAVTATVGSTQSALEVHGEADVTAQFFNWEAVRVYTRNAGGAAATDLPFMLTAVC